MEPDKKTAPWQAKVLVLNEGMFQMNNSELTVFDPQSLETFASQFQSINGTGMGDTGNDLARYGQKVYVVMNVSSVVHVLDAHDGSRVHLVDVKESGNARSPREIAFHESYFMLANFDGTVTVYDTATWTLQRVIPIGRNPDGLAIQNGKLYVSNSGGLDAPNYDSTISVIDLGSWTEIYRIPVGVNPGVVHADQAGAVWVSVRGDYGNVSPELVRIDAVSDTLSHRFSENVNSMASRGDTLFLGGYDFQSGVSSLKLWRSSDLSELHADWVPGVAETLYDVQYLPVLDRISVCDAQGFAQKGVVHLLSPSGTVVHSFDTEINPSEVLYLP